MKPTLLYRIASVVFVLFALGHTFGFLTFRPHSAEGLAVWNAMNNVHFHEAGGVFSYGEFYVGFGLSISASTLFSAIVSWHLGKAAIKSPATSVALAWSFFALQLVGVVLSFLYFALAPQVLSALVAICLGCAAWGMHKASVAQHKRSASVGREALGPPLDTTRGSSHSQG